MEEKENVESIPKNKKEILREIFEWLFCIIFAVILAVIFRYYVGTPTVVKQTSMYPTLVEDERLWLNRWARTVDQVPNRGDIVTFEAPSKGSLTSEDLNEENPVAYYENEIEGIINKFKYYVLEMDKDSYIKRVIALPGEHVEIKQGKIFINGDELEEEYLSSGIATDVQGTGYTDFIVPENTLFLVGDNRNHSTDSRHFGCVPFDRIESIMAFRFWPLNKLGGV